MADPRSYERLREVGLLERLSTARHSLGFYNNVATSLTYSRPESSQPVRLVVYNALQSVIAQHPSLSVVPIDQDKPVSYFARLPILDLREIVSFVTRTRAYDGQDGANNDELDELLEQQHNQNFQHRYGELPMWRLIILHENGNESTFVACFVFHHAIADGTSGMAFHRSFLAALSASTRADDGRSSTEPDPIVPSCHKALLPNVESLHPLPLSASFLLRAVWNDWFPKVPDGLWTGSPIVGVPPHKNRFRSFKLSSKTTAGLLAASRLNSVTLQAIVEVLVATAIFTHLDPDKYRMLKCGGPISLRRWLPAEIDEDVMGVWVSQYSAEHRRPQGSLSKSAMAMFEWNEARRVRSTIEAELSKEASDSPLGLLRWVGDTHEFYKKKVGRARETSFEVSNIGVFRPRQGEGSSGWTTGRIVFSQSATTTGEPFTVSIASGQDKCLSVGVSWTDDELTEDWVRKVMSTLKDAIEEKTR